MYRTEKQLTTKQNKVIYEEVYFSSNMTRENFNDNSGYLLTYPNKFSQNPSQDKSIGIRRIEVIPPSHTISVAVEFDNGAAISPFVTCEYQSSNNLQEILVNLLTQLKTGNYFTTFVYEKLEGKLQILAYNNNQLTNFRFVCVNKSYYQQLWQLFNQGNETLFEGYLSDNLYNNNSLSFVSQYAFYTTFGIELLYIFMLHFLILDIIMYVKLMTFGKSLQNYSSIMFMD